MEHFSMIGAVEKSGFENTASSKPPYFQSNTEDWEKAFQSPIGHEPTGTPLAYSSIQPRPSNCPRTK
jgi:hypothetical protein